MRQQDRIRLSTYKFEKREINRDIKILEDAKKVVEICNKTKQPVVIVKGKTCGCKKFENIVQVNTVKINELKKINKQAYVTIQTSRNEHIKTFQNITPLPTKRTIIVHRYDVKIQACNNKIHKAEDKIKIINQQISVQRTPALIVKLEQAQNKLVRLETIMTTLKTEVKEVKELKKSSCVCPTTCADSLHKILNIIHINLITRSGNNFRGIKKTIRSNISHSRIIVNDVRLA